MKLLKHPFFMLAAALVAAFFFAASGYATTPEGMEVYCLGTALAVTNPTLLDLAKRLDPKGNIDKIIEILAQTNEMIEDIPWIESNMPTGHLTTIRSGLPTPTWRRLYGGVQPGKSRTVQVTDTMGNMEAYAEVDKKLADINGNAASFRMSEDKAHIEGMNQEFAQTIFYGHEGTAPAEFTGLAPRFNSLSAENASNIIVGGSSDTDNTSVWLVVWGDNTVHGIYPKGSEAGWKMTDKGQVTIEDADGNGGRMEAYRTHYEWGCGLTVRDWRYIVRIPNIELSALTKDAGSGADLIDLMTQALELPPSLTVGRAAFYCNRTIRSYLRRQLTHRVKNSTLTFDTVAGKRILALDGVPVRRCDAITNTEALVS